MSWLDDLFSKSAAHLTLVSPDQALAANPQPIAVTNRHFVLGTPIIAPFPDGLEQIVVGMGCFWGAEKEFWQLDGVYTTAVGYAGGFTGNPTYQQVCSGRTGHTEVVLVVFDPAKLSLAHVLQQFWENHDPTQGMRQGNDAGTQYRSAIYFNSPGQEQAARQSAAMFGERLKAAGYSEITTEIAALGDFFYAEDYHQQYLAKNPGGYCPVHATGVSCPVGLLD